MTNEKRLKSVHITNYYHKSSGGISLAYNRLLEAANAHKRFVRLIVPGEQDAIEEVGEYGRIYYVQASKSPLFDKRYRILLPWKTYIFDEAPIKKILQDENPDIVEIGEKYTLSLMAGLIRKGILASLGRPMLVHLSCERMDDNIRAFVSGGKIGRWFSRRLMGNYVVPMFDFHIANSDYTAQEIFDSLSESLNPHRSTRFIDLCFRFFRAAQVPIRERVFVNQCGADDGLFSSARKNAATRERILSEAGFPENATVLLYAGRISPEKNVKLLPQLLKSLVKFNDHDPQHREYRLLIAGDGPRAAWLQGELERGVPGKYKFLGHLTDREKLADIYANSDVFVHPNPREPFGIAPLEAMASGLPVVAPNSGGVLSYANERNAWLAKAGADDYLAAVRDIADDPEGRTAKTEYALRTAREFTWENSSTRLFALYDRMHEDFSRRRELYAYKPNPRTTSFVSQFFGDLNRFSPVSFLFTIRCCDTRLQIAACIAYFLSVSLAFVITWSRRLET